MGDSTGAAVTAPVAVKQVESAVEVLVGSVTGSAGRDLSHEELGDLVTAVRAQQARLDAVILAAVGEVDARGSHVHDGALSTGAWLRSTVATASAGPPTAYAALSLLRRSGTLLPSVPMWAGIVT